MMVLTRLAIAVRRAFSFRLRLAIFLTSARSLLSSFSAASDLVIVFNEGMLRPLGSGGGVLNKGSRSMGIPEYA